MRLSILGFNARLAGDLEHFLQFNTDYCLIKKDGTMPGTYDYVITDMRRVDVQEVVEYIMRSYIKEDYWQLVIQ